MRTCQRTGCDNEGKWQPVIKILAGPEHGEHPPAIGYFNLAVCDECREGLSVDDILTPEAKEITASQFANRGWACPDFTRATLEFEPLDDD